MILIFFVAIAALSVPIGGGTLSRLQTIRLKWPATILSALVLQVLIISVIPTGLPSGVSRAIHLSSYALAVIFLWVNRRIPGLWLIGAGGMSNLVAISSNGGVMPASKSALLTAGRVANLATGGRHGFSNSGYQAGEHVRFLGDIFAIPKGWPMSNVFSIGDVLIVTGAFVLLHDVCRSRPARFVAALRQARAASPDGQSPVTVVGFGHEWTASGRPSGGAELEEALDTVVVGPPPLVVGVDVLVGQGSPVQAVAHESGPPERPDPVRRAADDPRATGLHHRRPPLPLRDRRPLCR